MTLSAFHSPAATCLTIVVAEDVVIVISDSENRPDEMGKLVMSSCSGGGSLSLGMRHSGGIDSSRRPRAFLPISSQLMLTFSVWIYAQVQGDDVLE